MKVIIIGVLGTVTKELIQGLEDLEIRGRVSRVHSNHNIIEIGQNTEKSPGDLRRLAVTQTSVKDHQLKLMRKTLNNMYKRQSVPENKIKKSLGL